VFVNTIFDDTVVPSGVVNVYRAGENQEFGMIHNNSKNAQLSAAVSRFENELLYRVKFKMKRD